MSGQEVGYSLISPNVNAFDLKLRRACKLFIMSLGLINNHSQNSSFLAPSLQRVPLCAMTLEESLRSLTFLVSHFFHLVFSISLDPSLPSPLRPNDDSSNTSISITQGFPHMLSTPLSQFGFQQLKSSLTLLSCVNFHRAWYPAMGWLALPGAVPTMPICCCTNAQ